VRQTLENLRERSREEKHAIAAWISIALVIVLFLLWAIFFFHSIAAAPASNTQNQATVPSTSDQQPDLQQAYGTTSQFIESGQGNIQVEEVGTTSAATQ
jgi:cytoskeletal protein RodZ